jgi:hypothetical protein
MRRALWRAKTRQLLFVPLEVQAVHVWSPIANAADDRLSSTPNSLIVNQGTYISDVIVPFPEHSRGGQMRCRGARSVNLRSSRTLAIFVRGTLVPLGRRVVASLAGPRMRE